MKQAIWTIFLLILAGLIGYGATHYPGTAEFVVAGFKITMSIYVFALLLLFLMVLILFVSSVYRLLVNMPSRFGSWKDERRASRALDAVKSATIAVHEGRWAHVDKAVKVASNSPQSAGVAALLGAVSAQAQMQHDVAQEWLKGLDGDADFADASVLQQAQMALHEKNPSLALTTLEHVSSTARKHSVRYRELLIQANADMGRWHDVLQIAKDSKWQASLQVKNQWFAQAAQALCADSSSSLHYLQSIYKDMPDDVRAQDAVLIAYVRALIHKDELSLARRAIEEAMRVGWRPALLSLYVQAGEESSYTEQLKAFDVWEAQHTQDAVLFCAAGQLCFKASIWGRAKANFQNSLTITPSVAAHYGLAQTYRALEGVSHAQEEERKAAELAVR